jgi:transposase
MIVKMIQEGKSYKQIARKISHSVDSIYLRICEATAEAMGLEYRGSGRCPKGVNSLLK